ncbi:MAG: KdsC family phosphatase [Planctomycetota bacterium]
MKKRPAKPADAAPPPPPPEAAAIRLLVLDCDGVLTDGRLLYGPGGEVYQRFSVYDGYAIELLKAAGVEVAILTGKTSSALMHRAQTLGIRKIVQGASDKAAAIKRLAEQSELALAEVAFVGDDLFDLGAVRLAAWSAAPANARPEVKAEVSYVCAARGGDGAVRELAEILLRARDAWPPAVAAPPGDPARP